MRIRVAHLFTRSSHPLVSPDDSSDRTERFDNPDGGVILYKPPPIHLRTFASSPPEILVCSLPFSIPLDFHFDSSPDFLSPWISPDRCSDLFETSSKSTNLAPKSFLNDGFFLRLAFLLREFLRTKLMWCKSKPNRSHFSIFCPMIFERIDLASRSFVFFFWRGSDLWSCLGFPEICFSYLRSETSSLRDQNRDILVRD